MMRHRPLNNRKKVQFMIALTLLVLLLLAAVPHHA